MKQSVKKYAWAILCLAVISAALAWRLWPHSLGDMIASEENVVTDLACTASVSGLQESGQACIDNYQLQALRADREGFGAVMRLLEQSQYRQDFQNLLPWPVTSVGSDGGSGKSAAVFLAWGSDEPDSCFLTFHSDGSVVVSRGADNGLLVYHATDDRLLNSLADYIQTHGDKT